MENMPSAVLLSQYVSPTRCEHAEVDTRDDYMEPCSFIFISGGDQPLLRISRCLGYDIRFQDVIIGRPP